MANIAIFEPNKTPQYLSSVSEGPYVVDINVDKHSQVPLNSTILINPDISSVKNVPLKYWKKVGNTIVEMSVAEKQTVDDAELQLRKIQADDFRVNDMKIVLTALVKVLNNKLPANKQITKQEVVDAIKAEIL